MGFLVEFLLQFIWEFVIQIAIQFVFAILLELSSRIFHHALFADDDQKNPFLAALGYVIIAVAIGLISVKIHPVHILRHVGFRAANLIVTPIGIGLIMGARRKRLILQEKVPVRIDSFIYGFLFSFVYLFIRFVYCVDASSQAVW